MNARSIKNKQEDLTHILKTKYDIHVICITETFVKEGEDMYFGFDGYSSYFACRPIKGGGGSAILIQNHIKHELMDTYSDDENSLVTVRILLNNHNWTIVNTYRPPNHNQHSVNNFLHMINHTSTNTIVTGDFNFDTIEKNDNTLQYLDTMLMNNLYICNTDVITRDATGTALDHIHTNNLHSQLNIHYVPYDILDHKIIFIEINNTTLPTTEYHTKQTTRKTDYISLNTQLQQTPIQLQTSSDINNMYNMYVNKKIKPWYDEQLDKLLKAKNYWYKKKINDPSNPQIIIEYKLARNLATTMKRGKKQQYFHSGFEKSINNNKQTWKYIKNALYNGSAPGKSNITLTQNNPQLFASELNQYISTIGTNLLNQHQEQPFYARNRTTATFKFIDVTPQQVKHTIAGLKNTTSCGHDNIQTKVFKNNADELAGNISNIINKSIRTALFQIN